MSDLDIPAIAEALGWDKRSVQGAGAWTMLSCTWLCEHKETDGTVNCPCGVSAKSFIHFAKKYLQEQVEYPMRVYRDPDSKDWVAEIPDLPGCIGVGSTRIEAVAVAESHIKDWIDCALENAYPIPKPTLDKPSNGS